MNAVGFLRLIHQIYGRGVPDTDWIQKQGLLAVKIGQIHALRIDFLDSEKCQGLARLFRQNEKVPPEGVDRLIRSTLTPSQRARIAWIDPDPLASASVGQVHRGRLDTGDEVVIKLIKRDVRDEFLRDVLSVQSLLRLVMIAYPRLRQVGNPLGILRDVREYTLSELDLRNEVEGQHILRRIHEAGRRTHDLSTLLFARIHDDLSGERVMVSEYLSGRTFDELLAEGKLGYDRLLDLFAVHMYYVFGVGVFHGDIHPGNIISQDGHIYFVDTGYVGRVGDRVRKGLFLFVRHLAHYDYGACAHHLNGMAERPISGETYRRYRRKFLDLYADFRDTTVSQVSLTAKMMNTIKLGILSGMVFEPGVFPIIRSLMYLDGMALRCKPDAVLMRDMRELVDDGESFTFGGA